MTTSKNKSRSALGNNPLSKGIFSKTDSGSDPDVITLENQESRIKNLDSEEQQSDPEATVRETASLSSSKIQPKQLNQESRIKNQESRISGEQPVERVNLRLTLEINEWLDNLLKQGKRKHGRKIPKEVWVQAALDFFRLLPIEWQEIDSEASLREALNNIESRIKNQ